MIPEGSEFPTASLDPARSSARHVGPYKIVDQIGAGGMGEVFLAVDTRLGRRVAVKFITKEGTEDPERVRRFRQEARAASALNHPNILTVHELGEADGTQYIVAELVEGETLRERMKRGRMPIREIVDVTTQIASALAAAHGAGVVHRDIKPENVMIRRDGIVKVVDFGLAKLTETAELSRDASTDLRTTEGVVRGTLLYMSPEQARGSDVDARSDLWSLGATLYEMLAGSPPFTGRTRADVIAEILTKEPALPDAAEPLRRIVGKALRKNRDERYQSASEFLADLRAMDVARPTPRRSVLIALAAAAIIAASASVFLLTRSRTTHAPSSRAVAVLPFVNMSGDSHNEYLSDGMTEEVINSLSHVADLKVVSRTSVFAFKGKNADVREVADKLGVTSVVEGSIQKSGHRLRVTAQLINAQDGYHLWSDTFDRDVNDIFAIQDEIAAAVAEALRSRLGVQPQARRSRDLAVWELYVKGRHERDLRSAEGYEASLRDLRTVVERDPAFADGWAALADAYGMIDHLRGRAASYDVTKETHALAVQASNRALALDPNCAEAHAAIGHILTHDGDFAEAERRLRRALQLNPNSAISHLWYGVLLTTVGRKDEAPMHLIRARDLDPLSGEIASIAGWMLSLNGDFVEATEYARGWVRLAPANGVAYLQLARLLAMQGKRPEAEASLSAAEARQAMGAGEARALIDAIFGKKAEARALLHSIEQQNEFQGRELMMGWAAAGDVDRAVEVLNVFVSSNPSRARVNIVLPPHPVFADFVNDRRYQEVRRNLGLPPLVYPR